MEEDIEAIKQRLEAMHAKQLEMFKWLHEFCTENNIKYYAIAGTLLGAVRHGGFIPWDDDIDVSMPRPDYDKFVALMKGKTGRFIAETAADGNKEFTHKFCRLIDTTTTIVYQAKGPIKRGLSLDVFPFDGIGNTEKESMKYYKKMKNKVHVMSAKTRAFRKGRKFYQNAAIVIAKILPYNWRKMLMKLHKKLAQKSYYDCEYVCNFFGVWREKEIMKREWLGEPKLYKFEDMEVWGPQDADSCLKQLYGDYMTPPPENKRYPKHEHAVISMDLNKSYLDD
ncbi:MAG: LicD family protein [Clostridiales bacterium]|nr:LicD family protein [Clostridiales bacterium]